MASQMSAAVFNTMAVNIKANDYDFKANGQSIKFKGFMTLYIEGTDGKEEEQEGMLPPLEENQKVSKKKLNPKQSFTEPPARYTEASLVNVEFTADVETRFDKIAEGNEKWKDVIREFYGPFIKEVEKVEKELEHVQLVDEESDVVCELCGRKMVYKYGRFGKFLACPGYPECKNVKSIVNYIDVPCPVCGARVIEKKTKRGKKFYVCENGPDNCNYISWNKPKVGEKWTPEMEKENNKKKTTTRKTTKKRTKKGVTTKSKKK